MDTRPPFLPDQPVGAIVIVGGGAAGMAAAIAACQGGARDVTILEASDHLGGNAVYAPMPSLTVPADPAAEAQADYLAKMNASDWYADARIVRTLCDQAVQLPAWLSAFSGDTREGERGGALAAVLEAQCRALHVKVRLNCHAKHVIQDTDGGTTGVQAIENNQLVEIPAVVAIIASGGFLGDTALLKQYIPYMDDAVLQEAALLGNPYSGDGVRMALELGAGDEKLVTLEWQDVRMPFAGPLPESIQAVVSSGACLWVNNVGVRYCNEGAEDAKSAMVRQPNKDTFLVIDHGILEELARRSPDKLSVKQFLTDLEPLIDADQALICGDAGPLAAWIRGKKHILQHAFDRYNECCAAGCDFLFGKDAADLIAFQKPPFYVFRSGLPLVMTHGPVKVNPMMSCVTATDFPVRGVLACGGVLGGLYAGPFISTKQADSLRFSLASGVVSGGHAASFIGGGKPAPKFEFPKFSARQVMAGDFYNVGTVTMPPNGPGGPMAGK